MLGCEGGSQSRGVAHGQLPEREGRFGANVGVAIGPKPLDQGRARIRALQAAQRADGTAPCPGVVGLQERQEGGGRRPGILCGVDRDAYGHASGPAPH